MAQYKSGDPGVPQFIVENGSQTVVIPGVDARTDIPFSADRPPYFREQETGPTYEVASAPQYTGGDTVVTLTGAWQGDSGEIDGLFHVDFSANMGYPLFYSGDIDIPDILRRWVVGLDGDMHDLIVGAITDHNDLDGRDVPDAHPISAISGLQSALDAKFDTDGAHNDLEGRDAPDAHPISSITGLQSALNAKFNADDAGDLATGDDASDVPVSGLSAPFDTAENVEQALALLRSAAGRDVGTGPKDLPDIEKADGRYVRPPDFGGPTAAQVGGGAIVEQGTNANGSYWRWESGLQVCVSPLLAPEYGGFADRAQVQWTYPAGFNAIPRVLPGRDGSIPAPEMAYGVPASLVTTTSAALRLIDAEWRFSSGQQFPSVFGLAIGTWK